jgi:serine-type D-Ala-D-Ala carboxypeptidase/endopeptidase
VAQLHPEKLPPTATASAAGKTLASAIQETHVVRAEAGEKMQIALNWMRVIESGTYWHNGGTGGYSSCALFDPTRDFAVVVLSNTAASEGSFADSLAAHIGQRLKGLPAVSLAPPQ